MLAEMLLRAGFWLIKEIVGNLLSRVYESINTGHFKNHLLKEPRRRELPCLGNQGCTAEDWVG